MTAEQREASCKKASECSFRSKLLIIVSTSNSLRSTVVCAPERAHLGQQIRVTLNGPWSLIQGRVWHWPKTFSSSADVFSETSWSAVTCAQLSLLAATEAAQLPISSQSPKDQLCCRQGCFRTQAARNRPRSQHLSNSCQNAAPLPGQMKCGVKVKRWLLTCFHKRSVLSQPVAWMRTVSGAETETRWNRYNT